VIRRAAGAALALLALLLATATLRAQTRSESPFGDANSPVINARQVTCIAASRVFIPMIIDRMNTTDIAFPTSGLAPTITVGFRYLGLPPDVQLFVYFHVCAHHARGDVRPGDRFRANNEREYAADCDAALRMHVRDMLTPQLLDGLRAVISDARVRRIVACVNDP